MPATNRLAAIFGLALLLMLPLGALAQYNNPSSGPAMGGQPPSMGNPPAMNGNMPSMGDRPTMGNMPTMPTMASNQSDSVTIVDFAFQPRMISVPVRTTVTWQNNGAATHTVTSTNGAFDSGNIGSGGSFSQTFSNAGMYMYHCDIHPNMMGTVMVTGS